MNLRDRWYIAALASDVAGTDLLARHIEELRTYADRGEVPAPCEEQVPIRF